MGVGMDEREEKEFRRRRSRRGVWIGALLAGFALLVFGITVAKLSSGQMIEGFDHSLRPSLAEGDK